jgi:glycosyltransferase involved in cell wall biosynthesis
MKLLVVSNFNSHPSARHFVELIAGLQKKGIHVTIMSTSTGSATDYLLACGVKFIEHHPSKKFDLVSIRLIKGHLISGNYDILYLLNSKGIANGIRAAMSLPVKVVTYRGAFRMHWYDPFLYITHLNRRVDKVICLSEAVATHVKQLRTYMRAKTEVITHGFDPEWFKSDKVMDLSAYGIPESAFVIGCVANNRSVKGVKYLIRAMNLLELQNYYMLLIGRGMDKELEKEKQRLVSPERIKCVGHIDELGAAYNAIDLYVQPSLMEGLGKSIAEAMCASKPVIATRSGGSETLIVNEESGILVKPKSSKAIADQIIRLFENPELRDELGRNALQRIKRHFSVQTSVDKHYDFFKSLINQ